MADETIETLWELRTYDVLGNAEDGYEVNDTCVLDRAWPITLTVEVNNAGTPNEFKSASPNDTDIRAAFSLERVNRDGAWGIVGEYSTDGGQTWHHVDSCWGFVCYDNPLDPRENDYVPDIMQATIEAFNNNAIGADI